MKDLILSLPQQLAEGVELGSANRIARPYRNIISCGLGGSAIAGEMLSMVVDNPASADPDRTGIIVHWDYGLPASAASQDLVICTSWSGQTEEIISSYQEAIARGCETLTITTGGKLADLAHHHNTPLILLPSEINMPRMAIGYMVGALLAALGLEKRLPNELKPGAFEQQGRELAEIFGERTPIIYAAYPWRKLTGFWKMAYSETTKRQVFVNWFPSGAHSEIVGWEGPYQKQVTFLLFRDQNEPEQYAKNFQGLLAILPQKGYNVRTVELFGSAVLEKAFNNYILALWTSYYAALSLGVDPSATKLLNEFKKLKEAKNS